MYHEYNLGVIYTVIMKSMQSINYLFSIFQQFNAKKNIADQIKVKNTYYSFFLE